MSGRLPLLLIAIALLVGGFFGLRALLDEETPEREVVAVAPGSDQAPVTAPTQDLPSSRATPELPDPNQRTAAVTAELPEGSEAFELNGASWIEGRVLIPLGAPPEPELAIIAIALDADAAPIDPDGREALRDWREVVEDSDRWSRRKVDADGGFRIPLPGESSRARLYVDARFLFLRAPHEVALADAGKVVLEPELGGALLVRAEVPRDLEGAATEIVGAEIEVMASEAGGGFMGFGRRGLKREGELPDDLWIEFGGLPTDHRYFVSFDPEIYLGVREMDLTIEPGKVLEVAVAVEAGVTIAGRILGENGQPIAGADVQVDMQSQFSRMAGGFDRRTESAEDGSYLLRGVRARKLKIKAQKEGLVRAETEEMRPQEGARLEGIELVLGEGLTIAGRVHYADGTVATGARIELRPFDRESGDRVWSERPSVESDAEGRFECSGLGSEHVYHVTARAGEEDAAAREGHRMQIEDVEPGTENLALVLAAPIGLSGVVRTESGEPITNFKLRAEATESEFGLTNVSQDFENEAGHFLLKGVYAGRWTIEARAEGWVMLEAEFEVGVPEDGEIELAMVRAASIAGIVRDPNGVPIAGAEVELTRGSAGSAGDSRRAFGRLSRSSDSTKTDAEGTFRLEGLRAGMVTLIAAQDDWAPSPEQELELLAGDELNEIALTLSLGGNLSGEIFDAEGNPEAGRAITVFQMGGSGPNTGKGAASDEAGQFLVEHIAPGTYTVLAQPSFSALAELAEKDDDPNPIAFMSSMEMKSVEILDGQTTHVVLGEPPANPVRLYGRITENGQPVEEGILMVIAEGRSLVEAWKPAGVEDDGTYEIVLDEPGNYVISYQEQAFRGGGGLEFALTVPEAAEHRFDMELPGGALEGVVIGPDGAPVKGVSVRISLDSGPRTNSLFNQGNSERTDGDGTFRFERLKAGTYSLRAGGSGVGSLFGSGSRGEQYGTTILSDLSLEEDALLGGIELELSRPGSITGTVIGIDGTAIAGATIFVRDAEGRVVQAFSGTVSDGEGRFEKSGLSPGEYTVSARLDEAASPESDRVRVREGDQSEVQLALENGVTLRVVAETKSGEPVRVSVKVVDEAGRDHFDLRSFAGMEAQLSEGVSTSEIRIGPVPAGKYAVTLTSESGQVEKRTLTLKASRSERKLRLRFDEQ